MRSFCMIHSQLSAILSPSDFCLKIVCCRSLVIYHATINNPANWDLCCDSICVNKKIALLKSTSDFVKFRRAIQNKSWVAIQCFCTILLGLTLQLKPFNYCNNFTGNFLTSRPTNPILSQATTTCLCVSVKVLRVLYVEKLFPVKL